MKYLVALSTLYLIGFVGLSSASLTVDFFTGSPCSISTFYQRSVTLGSCTQQNYTCYDRGDGYYESGYCSSSEAYTSVGADFYATYQLVPFVIASGTCTVTDTYTFFSPEVCYGGETYTCGSNNNVPTYSSYQDGGCQTTPSSATFDPTQCYGGEAYYTCYNPRQIETVYSDSACTQLLYTHVDLTSTCSVPTSGCVATIGGYKKSSCAAGTQVTDFNSLINYPAYVEVQYGNAANCQSNSSVQQIYYRAINQCNNGGTYSTSYNCTYDQGSGSFTPVFNSYGDQQCAQPSLSSNPTCSSSPATSVSCINGVLPQYTLLQGVFTDNSCNAPAQFEFSFANGTCNTQDPSYTTCDMIQSGLYLASTCLSGTNTNAYDGVVSSLTPQKSYIIQTSYNAAGCSSFGSATYIDFDFCIATGSSSSYKYNCNDSSILRVNYNSVGCTPSTYTNTSSFVLKNTCYNIQSGGTASFRCLIGTSVTSSAITSSAPTTSPITSASSITSASITSGMQVSTTGVSLLTTSDLVPAITTSSVSSSTASTTSAVSNSTVTTRSVATGVPAVTTSRLSTASLSTTSNSTRTTGSGSSTNSNINGGNAVVPSLMMAMIGLIAVQMCFM